MSSRAALWPIGTDLPIVPPSTGLAKPSRHTSCVGKRRPRPNPAQGRRSGAGPARLAARRRRWRRGGRWRRRGGRGRRRRLGRTGPRSAGHHRRHPRTGPHAGPTRVEPGARRTRWRAARPVHAVVVMMPPGVLVPPDHGAREEDHRCDKDDAGDDHHPGGNLEKPALAGRTRRCRRRQRRRRGRWLRGFSHIPILLSDSVTAPEHAHDEQHRRRDEDESRDDCNPRRDLIEPVWPGRPRCVAHGCKSCLTARLVASVDEPGAPLRDLWGAGPVKEHLG